MRKLYILPFIFVAFIFSAHSQQSTQPGNFGVGLSLGSPTGPTAKFHVRKNQFVQAGLGWSLGSESFFLSSDYVFHENPFIFFDNQDHAISWYWGGGLRFGAKDSDGSKDGKETHAGIRVPIGAQYFIKKYPIETFVELAPVFDYVPDADLDLVFAIGARWYLF